MSINLIRFPKRIEKALPTLSDFSSKSFLGFWFSLECSWSWKLVVNVQPDVFLGYAARDSQGVYPQPQPEIFREDPEQKMKANFGPPKK